MKESKQNSGDHEDETFLDFEGIENSTPCGLEAIDLVLEPGSPDPNDPETEANIFPEFVYIEDDDSRTCFDFNSIRDCSNSRPTTSEVLIDGLEPS